MSAANLPPSVARTYRGKCAHCGSRWVVVCYGHVPPRAIVVADIEDECPALRQRPLPLAERSSELDDVSRETEKENDDDLPF